VLAPRGAPVADLAGALEDGYAAMRARLTSGRLRTRYIVVDVADPASVERAFAGMQADVLVNNAGVGALKPFVELTPEEWRRMVDVNFNALYYVTRCFLPGMLERGLGDVVTIGSLAGRNAFAGGSCYAATKWAVIGFTESLMLEVRDRGVRVSVVMPGSVATDFSPRGAASGASWKLTADQVADSVAHTLNAPRSAHVSRIELRPSRPAK
jgi:3-oxoacyl-[acyl-carrier protein] reductase